MFLPALVFLCAAMHHVGRARSGTWVHRADVASVVAAWLILPSAILWCFAAPCREGGDAWAYDDALAHVTVLALIAVSIVLASHALSWWSVAREARRWRRGRGPSRPGLDFGVGEDWVRTIPSDAPYRSTKGTEVLAFGSPAAAAATLRWNFAALLAVIAALGSVTWLSVAARGSECVYDELPAEHPAIGRGCSATRRVWASPGRSPAHHPEWNRDWRQSAPILRDLRALERRSPPIEIWGRQPIDLVSAPDVDLGLPSWTAPDGAGRSENSEGSGSE